MLNFEIEPNCKVRIGRIAFRVCVYRTSCGWSSFVEDRFYRGSTGTSGTARHAWLRALRLASEVAR